MKDEYSLEIDGWGPCFHSREEAEKIRDWIDHLCPPRTGEPPPAFGGQIEDLLWYINIYYNGDVELFCDQWTGVVVKGSLRKLDDAEHIWKYRVRLESDSFLAGIAGAYAWLVWTQAEVNAGLHDAVAKRHK